MKRRLPGLFGVGALAVALAPACIPPGPGQDVVECLQGCAREKDACMVAATTARAITACDMQSAACGDRCDS